MQRCTMHRAQGFPTGETTTFALFTYELGTSLKYPTVLAALFPVVVARDKKGCDFGC